MSRAESSTSTGPSADRGRSGSFLTRTGSQALRPEQVCILDLSGQDAVDLSEHKDKLGAVSLPADSSTVGGALAQQPTWLMLHNNCLSNISALFHYAQLVQSVTVLTLYDNNLSSLPPEIGTLKSLTVLSARKNQLETLPSSIGELRSLQWLYLQSNCITHLPYSLGCLSNLKFLDLSDNPLDGKDGPLSALVKNPLTATRLILNFCLTSLQEPPKLAKFKERGLSSSSGFEPGRKSKVRKSRLNPSSAAPPKLVELPSTAAASSSAIDSEKQAKIDQALDAWLSK